MRKTIVNLLLVTIATIIALIMAEGLLRLGDLKFLMQQVEFNTKLNAWQHIKDSHPTTENA